MVISEPGYFPAFKYSIDKGYRRGKLSEGEDGLDCLMSTSKTEARMVTRARLKNFIAQKNSR